MTIDREITAVKDGETLSLGNRTLTFMETRMLHWPDSMFAYLNEEQLLFSQDAFGMHYASLERFDDEIDPAILGYEAATYYANILLPYSPLVLKLLEKVTASGLAFRLIAPDHGPIWRKDIGGIIGRYAKWAAQKPKAQGRRRLWDDVAQHGKDGPGDQRGTRGGRPARQDSCRWTRCTGAMWSTNFSAPGRLPSVRRRSTTRCCRTWRMS